MLEYSDGTEIETTWNHPFYIQGKGWVEVKDLEVGDLSLTSGDTVLEITGIRMKPAPQTVYNIHLDKDHTYFVTDSDVLVHNYGEGESLRETLERKQNYPRVPEPDKGGALRQHRLEKLKDTPGVSLHGRRSVDPDESSFGIPYLLEKHTKTVTILDENGEGLAENKIERMELLGLFDFSETLNGEEIVDGGIIATDFRTGKMSMVNADQVTGHNNFVSTTGISNEAFQNADRSIDLMNGAINAGYERVYHIVHDDDDWFGLPDPAIRTMRKLIEDGRFRDGGAIVAHSRGTEIVGRALIRAQTRTKATVYSYGGAHVSHYDPGAIDTRYVDAWVDFFNANDGLTLDSSRASDPYIVEKKRYHRIVNDANRWHGTGHSWDEGYQDAFDRCFPNWRKCI